MNMATLLWLDDWRDPRGHAKFDGNIHWVKSVEAFEAYLQEYGLPDKISFDYCLGKDLDMFKDGIGAAKAVLRYCMKDAVQMDEKEGKLDFPIFEIHSDHAEAYKLQQYIVRNIDLYDLGEVRQEGKIHEKPEVLKTDGYKNPFDNTPTYAIHAPYKSYSPPVNIPVSTRKPLYPNLGRNDLCGCGSGKKLKKCCVNKTQEK